MRKFLYIEKMSLMTKIIGNLLLIIGFSLLFFLNIKFGPIFILLWVALIIGGITILSNEGIELDFKNNQYRNLTFILGTSFGLWKSFPKMDYISVFRSKVTKSVGGVSFESLAEAAIIEKVIIINLFLENGKPITLYVTKSVDIALEVAERVKEEFGIEIVNKL